MGKSVTVLPGFSYVEGPSVHGPRTYAANAPIVFTDAEYSALTTTTLRCLSSATTVPDPARPATDPNSRPVNIVSPATGAVPLMLGPNQLLMTGNVTVTFPVAVASGPNNQNVFTSSLGPTGGNRSEIELFCAQDATGSRTLTLPSSAKAAGGTAPVLSTGANKVDYLKYETIDGGVTWVLTDKQLDLR